MAACFPGCTCPNHTNGRKGLSAEAARKVAKIEDEVTTTSAGLEPLLSSTSSRQRHEKRMSLMNRARRRTYEKLVSKGWHPHDASLAATWDIYPIK
jgi:hypothetical protein